MNEVLQQRIESIQASQNMTHAQLAGKKSLREQLDSELAEFFANGGKTQVIPRGFTHFKDGIIPQCRVPAICEKERIEREKALEAKNQEIRDYKAALKAQRQNKSQQIKNAQLKEQIKLLSAFEEKSVNKNDFIRLSEMAGYKVRHMRDAAKGHSKLCAIRWEEIKLMINNFEFDPVVNKSKKKSAKGVSGNE